MFENSDAVSFATNGEATYHYPNRDHRTIGPFGSGATLKTDGEKIVGRVEAPAFKVGSVYRDRDGDVIRLTYATEKGVEAEFLDTDSGRFEDHGGFFNLADGTCRRWPNCNLLPGELVQRDGQWVAMEEEVGINGLTEAETSATASVAGIDEKPADINAQMLANDARQPTARERGVMARINLAKSLAADWEAAKKQPALPHPYPFARNFQG